MSIPKRQVYPSTRIIVGASLYSAYSQMNDGKVETGYDEWVVRNIRAKRNTKTRMGVSLAAHGVVVPNVVNLVKKTEWTWGKRSTKTGDIGWLPKIWKGDRLQFKVGSDLPTGVYTTKRAALNYALARCVEDSDWYAGEISAETDSDHLLILRNEHAEVLAQIAALKRRANALAKKQ